MEPIFLTVICPAISHLENVNKYRLANLNKDWLRNNQDDNILLCITGMNVIINLKKYVHFSGGGGIA